VVLARNNGTISNRPQDVLDIGHAKMMALGGPYDQTYVNKLEADAKAYFISQYGLDFTNASGNVVNSSGLLPPGGLVILPGIAVMYPYSNSPTAGPLYRVAFDSAHNDRTLGGDWFVRDVGMIVFMLTTGTFTGGVMNGTGYSNSSVLFWGDYNWLKVGGNWSNYPACNCREILHIDSYVPSTQTLNGQGYFDNAIRFRITDAAGNVGLALITIHVWLPPGAVSGSGQELQRIRGVFTWDCPPPGNSAIYPYVLCPSPPEPAPPTPAPSPCNAGRLNLLVGLLLMFVLAILNSYS
jgi:hypothetical protein